MPKAPVGNGYKDGFRDGVEAVLAALAEYEIRPKAAVAAARAAEALRSYGAGLPPTTKRARSQRLRRLFDDEGLALKLAELVKGGEVTKSAGAKLGIGNLRAKRVRAAAVRLGYLERARE